MKNNKDLTLEIILESIYNVIIKDFEINQFYFNKGFSRLLLNLICEKKNEKNMKILISILKVLSVIVFVNKNKIKPNEKFSQIKIIFDLLKKKKNEDELILILFSFFNSIADDREYQNIIIKFDGVDIIMDFLKEYKNFSNDFFIKSIFEIFWVISQENEEIRNLFSKKKDWVEFLFNLMKGFLNSQKKNYFIIESFVGFLSILSTSIENQNLIIKNGGIEFLTKFLDDENINENFFKSIIYCLFNIYLIDGKQLFLLL
jgi:hypothetical protein